MSKPKKITLLIPTKNRSDFLKRLLLYYKKMGFKGFLAIGDSSDNQDLRTNRELVKSLGKELNIIYREFHGLPFLPTVYKLFQLVNTSYVAELHDDNFIVPRSIDKCIEFLENNHDYSSVHGKAIGVKTMDSKPHGKIIRCVRKRQPIADEKKASHRYLNLMSHFSDVHYSVHRTNIYSRVLQNSHISDLNFFHSLSSCHVFLGGKVGELNLFYLVRHIQDEPHRYPEQLDPIAWINNWSSNLSIYRESVIKELINSDKIEFDEAEKIFEQGLLIYLSMMIPNYSRVIGSEQEKYFNKYYGDKIIPLWSKIRNDKLIRSVIYYYPRFKDFFERLRYRIFGGEVLENNILNYNTNILLSSLLNRKSKYHKDFMPVYNSITNPLENV